MSKVSVFKFNTNNMNIDLIENIMKDYLNNHGFSYNHENNCYMNGVVDEAKANAEVAGAVAGSIVTGAPNTSLQFSNSIQCISYSIINNQLVITAYIYNAFSKIKSYIQPGLNTIAPAANFYREINSSLFNTLKENNIILVSSEKEKINDGSGVNLFLKTILFTLPVIIIFAIIIVVLYIKSQG